MSTIKEPIEFHFSEFDEYIRQGEPDQREKASIWSMAIGLQQVDQLQTSDFLQQTAKRNIEGEISMEEAAQTIRHYYVSRTNHEESNADVEEADRVSTNIACILKSKTFNFSTLGFTSLHRRIFDGVMKHAGELRKYDITKKEWVLQGDTVLYLNWEDLRQALDYDIGREKEFSYKGISKDEMIAHLAQFVSGIWQIHAFSEGNTRTTAVFTIQYLRSLGWNVDNDMFAKYAWYFRNALVRANYRNTKLDIEYTPVYLERFFRNLLFEETWELKSRYLYIAPPKEWQVQPLLAPTSTPTSTPTCTPTSSKSSSSINPLLYNLIQSIGDESLSMKEIMNREKMKDRKNFMEYHLTPALEAGLIRMLYPDSPQHPRQKYLLTPKGQVLYQQNKS